MKRRDLLTASAAASLSFVSAPAVAQGDPEIHWRLTSSFPKSLDTLWGGAETFCKAVAEATDNKFQIQPFAAGEIVKGRIIEVRPKEVLVDIGYKSEGVIPGNEFDDINHSQCD